MTADIEASAGDNSDVATDSLEATHAPVESTRAMASAKAARCASGVLLPAGRCAAQKRQTRASDSSYS
jgi:hypothetical protein